MSIGSTFKSLKSNIAAISQLAVVLLQLVGTFLIRPDFFNIYQNGKVFLAGDYPVVIMLFISIVFIYVSSLYKKQEHAKGWFITCIITFCLFSVCYYQYNGSINAKTTLFQTPELEAERIIKGDSYTPLVQKCAENLGVGKSELEVIQNCSDVTTPSEIDKVWPKEQILMNRNILLIYYGLSLMLGCIALVTGIQAIKCRGARKVKTKT